MMRIYYVKKKNLFLPGLLQPLISRSKGTKLNQAKKIKMFPYKIDHL